MLGLSYWYFDYVAAKLTILVASKLYFADMTQPYMLNSIHDTFDEK